MTIYYVDIENGNDANAGTSFALRKKTIASAASVAANNDTIRVMQSDDPTSIGSTSWTQGSNSVTIPANLVKTVDMCESGWTASANVTNTYSTTAKEGTNALNCAVAAAFTTGVAAYKTLSSTDFSDYQQLSFWIRQSAGTVAVAGDLTINLCSNTTGTTVVNSFAVPALGALNTWHAFTINLGTNLGSAIQSVAFVLNVDRGAVTFQIDNIITCKAASAADSISLRSLIGKNTGTEPWLPIRSINGTTVILDGPPATLASATTSGQYGGATETVTGYKRETVRTIPSSSTIAVVNSIPPINVTISGGWNTTDMSTQTGKTYLDGINGNGNCLSLSSGITGPLTFEALNFTRYNLAYSSASVAATFNFTASNINGMATGVVFPTGQKCTISIDNMCNNGTGGTISATNGSTISINRLWACTSGSAGPLAFGSVVDSIITIGSLNYNLSPLETAGVYGGTMSIASGLNNIALIYILSLTTTSTKVTLGSLNNTHPTSGYCLRINANDFSTIDCTGSRFTGTSQAVYTPVIASTPGSSGIVLAGTFTGPAQFTSGKVVFVGSTFSVTPTSSATGYGVASMQNYNATANDHRTFAAYGTIVSATDQRHTGSGISWKFAPTTSLSAASPIMELPLAQVAVASGSLVTASLWMRRSNTGIAGIFGVKGGNGTIVPATVEASPTGAANTWEQVTITFTPSAAGVVQLYANAYGGTTYNLWVDDLTVSQA